MRSFPPRLAARRVLFRAMGAVLLAAIALSSPRALWAQAREVTTTAVVPFQDKTPRNSPLLATKATDAVAMALADSREYLVTPAREVDREIAALGLSLPLSITEAVRLGKRLDVDSVCLGEVLQAEVNSRTGEALVRIQIMMADVEAAEFLDGATVSTQTKAIPGWTGTEAEILNEALRQCAERCVSEMLASRVPRGTIEAVLPSGTCELNIGAQDGAQPGMKMVVMRPVYVRELETVTLRKLGYVEVSRTQPDMSYADPLRNVAPRTGDYVIRVYEPYVVVRAEAAKQERTKFMWGVASLALLGALAGIAVNGNEGTAPPTPISYLHQDAMGDAPRIRVEFMNRDKAFGHLLFRGPSRGFPAEAYWLVEVSTRGMGTQTLLRMDDQPEAYPQKEVTITVNFRDEQGDWTTEDVTCTFVHPMLEPGRTYYHRIQRVTKPQFPPGTNPPLAQGSTDSAFQGPEDNEIEQDYDFPMLSRASEPAGPVTYILPPQLISPSANPLPQNPSAITFEWSPTQGADEYMVEVFPPDDPNGWGQPIFRRTGIRPRGATSISETWRPATGDLAPNSVYYWRVGARRSTEIGARGQGIPRVGAPPHEIVGYVLSEMRSFPTTSIPPEPPGTSVASAGPGTSQAGQAMTPGIVRTGKNAGKLKMRPAKSPDAETRQHRPGAKTRVWRPAPTVGPRR